MCYAAFKIHAVRCCYRFLYQNNANVASYFVLLLIIPITTSVWIRILKYGKISYLYFSKKNMEKYLIMYFCMLCFTSVKKLRDRGGLIFFFDMNYISCYNTVMYIVF